MFTATLALCSVINGSISNNCFVAQPSYIFSNETACLISLGVLKRRLRDDEEFNDMLETGLGYTSEGIRSFSYCEEV